MSPQRKIVCNPLGDLSRLEIQLVSLVSQTIFGEHDRRSAKRVRFDDVTTCLQIVFVDILHGCRLCDDKVFIAPVVALAAEIICREVLPLQVRSHRTVKDDDLFFQYVRETLHGLSVSLRPRSVPKALRRSFQSASLPRRSGEPGEPLSGEEPDR